MMNIFAKVSELLDKQETVAVVTIINHRGSVPRQLAKMCVTKKGETFGTVGGGCVEGQVVEEAAQMLRSGTRGVAVRSYDLIEEEFGGVGMNCGGKVEFSIEVVEPTPQLIVAGSGHLSSAIARLADALGFEVTVVDAMAERKHFPTAKLVVADFVGTHFQDMHIT
jgi:xanthine dehydrogenase accessory factor